MKHKTTELTVLELVNNYYSGDFVLTPDCFIRFHAGLNYTEYLMVLAGLEYYFDITLDVDKFVFDTVTIGSIIKYVEDLLLEQEW